MLRKLRDASMDGNVSSLHHLLQTDPLILDKQIIDCSTETPLHISSMRGHVSFTKEILALQPEMAAERTSPQKSTPLHLASAKGYVEIVKMLLMVNSEMCFASDNNGRNPLHVAVSKGRIDVLKELILARPLAARAVAEEGDTILHLCVKYNQVDALKLLVEKCISDDEFFNCKNHDGNTILHLAVADKHVEIVEFITSHTEVEVNGKNGNGYTALDILAQSRRDANDMLISESLQLVGGRRAKDLSNPYQEAHRILTKEANQNNQTDKTLATESSDDFFKQQNSWVEKQRNSIMVVASLIATMAFAAGINPPGGVWQENSPVKVGYKAHFAGDSIMANRNPGSYKEYLIYNTTSLISSLSIILLLISGLPIRRKLFMWILMVIMWISISTLVLTYMTSVLFLTESYKIYEASIANSLIVWLALVFLLLLGHTIRLTVKLFRKFMKFIRSWRANSNRNSTTINLGSV